MSLECSHRHAGHAGYHYRILIGSRDLNETEAEAEPLRPKPDPNFGFETGRCRTFGLQIEVEIKFLTDHETRPERLLARPRLKVWFPGQSGLETITIHL